MASEYSDYKFGTKAIHAGQTADQVSGAVIIPISLSTTFQQPSPGVNKGFEYARTGNPTRDAFEKNVAALENGKYGLAYASGLAATANILHLLQHGDELIVGDDVYGGTNRYFNRVLAPFAGIKPVFVDFNEEGAFEKAFNEKTKLVWIETPTNPTLKIFDIRAVAEKAHASQLIVVVDNTFASPYFQRPLDLGADIVMHSVTKYLNGHSDVVMGIVATNRDDLYTRLKYLQNAVGCIPSPFDSFLAIRGTKTLHVRMQRHEENAKKIATFLEGHPKVQRVLYPGLPSHPQHELAKKQMSGFSGMITFFIKGGIAESKRFLEALKIFALAESLGGVESLAEHPAIMTHASVPAEQRAKLGIDDTLVRLSVGIEDGDDLLNDIKNALDKV